MIPPDVGIMVGGNRPAGWVEENFNVISLGLHWLRCRLQNYIERLRSSRSSFGINAQSAGMVTDAEADWLLRRIEPAPVEAPHPAQDARRDYLIARQVLRDAGTPAAIDELAYRFGLTAFDEDLLLLALAPRIDAGFVALYGYAHDRISITAATLHLAAAMLSADGPAALAPRVRMRPNAPLRRFDLVRFEGDNGSLLSPIAMDERVADYLLGENYLDQRVMPVLKPLGKALLPKGHECQIRTLLDRQGGAIPPAVLILGPPGSGRRATAAALADFHKLRLMELEPLPLSASASERLDWLALLTREARLTDCAVLIDCTPDLHGGGTEERGGAARRMAIDCLSRIEAPLYVIGQDRVRDTGFVPTIHLRPLTAAQRTELWQLALGHAEGASSVVADLAEHFSLGPSEIQEIARESCSPHDTPEILWAICRERGRRGLEDLAARIESRSTWEDIVLPRNVYGAMRAMAAQVHCRGQVYGSWGFGEKLARNRGVSALFAGPSGVGKTMAAEVVAGHLGLDLFRVDLAGVVSKYIGETEKNLRRIFESAEAAGAVLLFDEADALFGKRSEIRDSHDRYANIEVSYLLQRMECYCGLAILATNMKNHLDAAFLRRLRFVIDFPFPDADSRREIWQRAFPRTTPTRELDYAALARLELAGGSIAVIAINAAFLAADEGQPVTMDHIARAARGEFRKLDKEFRPSWPVRAEGGPGS